MKYTPALVIVLVLLMGSIPCIEDTNSEGLAPTTSYDHMTGDWGRLHTLAGE
jgi:hypothetical protein